MSEQEKPATDAQAETPKEEQPTEQTNETTETTETTTDTNETTTSETTTSETNDTTTNTAEKPEEKPEPQATETENKSETESQNSKEPYEYKSEAPTQKSETETSYSQTETKDESTKNAESAEKPEESATNQEEQPAEESNENHSEQPAEESNENHSEQPAEESSESHSEQPTEESNQNHSEQPAEESNETQSEQQTEESNENHSEQPAENSTENHEEQPAAQTNENQPAQPAEPAPAPAPAPASNAQKSTHPKKMPSEFKRGFIISHYRLERLLQDVDHAYIWAVTDIKDNEHYAMKVEEVDPTVEGLKSELRVIPFMQKSINFPRFYEWGETKQYRWIVFELLGPCLKFVKWKLHYQHYSQCTAFKAASLILKCIEEFHRRGFIHGNICPANIYLRANLVNPVVLANFYQSKRYMTPEDVDTSGFEISPDGLPINPSSEPVKPPTEKKPLTPAEEFALREQEENGGEPVATAQPVEVTETHEEEDQVEEHANELECSCFSSANALSGAEQTRQDDLMSWFYVLCDMLGTFPVQNTSTDKAKCQSLNSKLNPDTLTKGQPKEIKEIYDLIKGLTPETEPDYRKIRELLFQALRVLKLNDEQEFDWNQLSLTKVKRISAIDFREEHGENDYSTVFDQERNVSQTPPPPPPAPCTIA